MLLFQTLGESLSIGKDGKKIEKEAGVEENKEDSDEKLDFGDSEEDLLSSQELEGLVKYMGVDIGDPHEDVLSPKEDDNVQEDLQMAKVKKEPSPLHTTTIVEKCTLKLVDDYKHMLCQATEPLSTFLQYITYPYGHEELVVCEDVDQFHYVVFFAYIRLREQEIRNLMWISECVAQNQKSQVHDSVVFIF
uniref:Uncharacterized protein n=1 Tax=Zea mays TaxID=4577 RepID=A0A804QVA7_MAIZE